MDNLQTTLDSITNETVHNSLIKANSVLQGYNSIICAVSGGADSDIVIDLLQHLPFDVHYAYYDTGLEYQATKDHIKELESKYNITIETLRPEKPIPTACKEYGLPFLSKRVSNQIERLQRHNFTWTDEPFEVLYKRYPHSKAALRWWCNKWGENSNLNITYNKGLKEFLIANPPTFKISDKCCTYAKKKVGKDCYKKYNADLEIVGLRKAEGGQRKLMVTCFEEEHDKTQFRPIFWYKQRDKEYYEIAFNIEHSKCYTEYGLKRTGCAGCPFGRDFENELEIIKKYEPKLYKACINIFGKSYEYTRKYNEFKRGLNT